jgi:predicted transcriptional regulator
MNVRQLRLLLHQNKIETMEIAAYCGMPESYIEKVLDNEVEPADADVKRIKKAIDKILRDRQTPDDNPFKV